MNLSDVFSITFTIIGFIAVCVGYWLMAAGLFPAFVERSAEQFGRAPARLGVLGLFTLVPLVVLGFLTSGKAANTFAKVIALGFVVVPLMIALFGSAGLALRVGAGLKSARDETEAWRRVLRGGVVVGLTWVLPFIGTFLVLPYTLLAGFGAFLTCAWRRQPAAAAAPVHPPALPATPVSLPTP